jgi:hypothetical protein
MHAMIAIGLLELHTDVNLGRGAHSLQWVVVVQHSSNFRFLLTGTKLRIDQYWWL